MFVPALAADYRYRIFFAGLEVGARLRPTTEFAGARVGTQLATGLGAGYDILDRERLSVMAEARSYVNFAEQHDTAQSAFGTTSRQRQIDHPCGVAARRSHRAAPRGRHLLSRRRRRPIPIGDAAITVPRFRFVLGAIYAPTARDTDGDGIIDKNDFCPAAAGKRRANGPVALRTRTKKRNHDRLDLLGAPPPASPIQPCEAA